MRSQLAIYQTLPNECPSPCCARVCIHHASALLTGSVHLSASYLAFFLDPPPFLLSLLSYFCFYAVVGACYMLL